MPLYEWRCGRCGLVFEVLVAAAEASATRHCPRCGRRSRRVASTFAVHGVGNGRSPQPDASGQDVTKLRVPSFARLCGMDDHSAARLAAYKLGRGAEFDDKVALGEEQRKARGEAAAEAVSPPHAHRNARKSVRKRSPAPR